MRDEDKDKAGEEGEYNEERMIIMIGKRKRLLDSSETTKQKE